MSQATYYSQAATTEVGPSRPAKRRRTSDSGGKMKRKFSGPVVSPAVKRYVKQYAARQNELKNLEVAGTNQVIYDMSAGLTPTNLNLVPLLTQGVAEGQRVGSAVNVKSARLKMFVNIVPYNASNNPVPIYYVRLLIVRAINLNTANFGNTDFNLFWQYNNTGLGPQSNMLDCCLSVNPDVYRCYYDKIIKLNYSASSDGRGGNFFYDSAGALSYPIDIDFTKYLKKKTMYEGTGTASQNDNLFIVMFTCNQYGDGSAGGVQGAEYHYVTSWKYTDA